MEKVSRDAAEAEFDRFAGTMDIETDGADWDEEDRKGFSQHRNRFVRAVMAGTLEVNDDGEPIFYPKRSNSVDPLHFKEPTGASLMAMDRRKKNEDIGKLHAVMASITGTDAKTFAAMAMSDLKVCQAITVLFLG